MTKTEQGMVCVPVSGACEACGLRQELRPGFTLADHEFETLTVRGRTSERCPGSGSTPTSFAGIAVPIEDWHHWCSQVADADWFRTDGLLWNSTPIRVRP